MKGLLIAAAVIAALTSQTSAGADSPAADSAPVETAEPPRIDPVVAITSDSEAGELEDIAVAAEEFGLSMEEAVKQFGWRDNFGYLAHQLRTSLPEDFARAEMEASGTTAWIAFAGQQPAKTKELIALFEEAFPHVTVEIRTDQKYTAVELNDAVIAVHEKVMARPDVADAVTEFNSSDMEILVTASTGAENLGVTDAILLEELDLPEVRAVSQAVSVRAAVQIDTQLSGEDNWTNHYGGETLSSCTAGFGVITTGGVRGISTAGHCSGSLTDDGRSLTLQGSYDASWGDYRWDTGPGTHSNGFYSGSSTNNESNLRNVTDVRWSSVGLWLCTNGKTTDKECDSVRQTGVCAGPNCNLFGMTVREQEPGDSGGPVFNNHRAYGLHKGFYTSGGVRRDSKSEALFMDYAISARVAWY